MNISTETRRRFIARHPEKSAATWDREFLAKDDSWGLVSRADDEYPFIIDGAGCHIEIETFKKGKYKGVINKKGAPEFLFYRGDIALLDRRNFEHNIAVIGLPDPTEIIRSRERRVIAELVNRGAHVVGRLSEGCDTIAHKACLKHGGKTIAVLPSGMDQILPAENTDLAEEILRKNGLLVSEYFFPYDTSDRFDLTNRIIERSRLVAYFSQSIILIASYRHYARNTIGGYPVDGKKRDSGARLAMEVAAEIGRKRYVMYNEITDVENEMFDLNRDLLAGDKPAEILSIEKVDEMMAYSIPAVSNQTDLFDMFETI